MIQSEADSLDDGEVIRRIEAAFDDDGMPDSIRARLRSWDDELDELFAGLRSSNGWQDLPPLYARIFDVSLIEGPVFQYFLPAIMRSIVRGDDFDRYTLDVLSLVNAICIPTARGQPPKFGVLLSEWTPAQRSCVADFLRWCQRVCFSPEQKVSRRIERALPYLLGALPFN
jgi:hypothetical protein